MSFSASTTTTRSPIPELSVKTHLPNPANLTTTTPAATNHDLSQPPPLAQALQALGYSPAATQSYDWLHAIPSARPFLHALHTALTNAIPPPPDFPHDSPPATGATATRPTPTSSDRLCVLSKREADAYAALTQRKESAPILPDAEAQATAAPLLSAPTISPSGRPARIALVKALKARLAHLRANADALQDVLATRHNTLPSPTPGLPVEEAPIPTNAEIAAADDSTHVNQEMAASHTLSALREILHDLSVAARLHTAAVAPSNATVSETVSSFTGTAQKRDGGNASTSDETTTQRVQEEQEQQEQQEQYPLPDTIAQYIAAERAEAIALSSILSSSQSISPKPLSIPRPPSIALSSDGSGDAVGGGGSFAQGGDGSGAEWYERERTVLIRSYAQLRAGLCMAEADIVRAKATEAALSSTDADAFLATPSLGNANDATHQSMNSSPSSPSSPSTVFSSTSASTSTSIASLRALTEDVRRRAEEALSSLAADVASRAACWLRDTVHARVLARVIGQHERRITVLEGVVRLLVQQRLRVLCVLAAQRKQADRMRELDGALAILEKPIATNAVVVAGGGDIVRDRSEEGAEGRECGYSDDVDDDVGQLATSAARQLVLAAIDNDEEKQVVVFNGKANPNTTNNDNNQGNDDDDDITTYAADAAEDAAYAIAHEEATTLLSTFRQRIGCANTWLDLQTTPAVVSAMQELKRELASNTMVLETILRNHERIQSDTLSLSTSHNAPNKDWVRLVTATYGHQQTSPP